MTLIIVAIAVAVWFAVSLALGVVVGRSMRVADRIGRRSVAGPGAHPATRPLADASV